MKKINYGLKIYNFWYIIYKPLNKIYKIERFVIVNKYSNTLEKNSFRGIMTVRLLLKPQKLYKKNKRKVKEVLKWIEVIFYLLDLLF